MITESELAHEVPEDIMDYMIDEALELGNLEFFLPVQWGGNAGDGIGGPSVEDPLTIYASWDVSGADHRVTFKTTLEALLVDTYELHTALYCRGDEGTLGETGVQIFEQIRIGLRRELRRVEGWIEKARHGQTITPPNLHAEDV